MISANTAYIGIDPTFGDKDFGYALLDNHLNLLKMTDLDMEELPMLVAGYETVFVAVNAPARVNLGLVKEKLANEYSRSGHALRGADIRLVEYELRLRGITFSGTPSRETFCPAWMRIGFRLHKELSELGIKPYGLRDAPKQILETNPHVTFCALAESIPLPKPSLMGRLQRQLILGDKGLGITDGMGFFQEITRFKLMKGILPNDFLYTPEQLDLLAAACTAWLAASQPGDVALVGDEREGQITVPVKGLKDKYSTKQDIVFT